MAGNTKPMTSRQAKKAYKARGGVAQLTEVERKQLQRAAELRERADAIREKEERRKENAQKKAVKDAKTAEMRAKQGLPPVPLPKVAASQPRLTGFLSNKKAVQPGKHVQAEDDEDGEGADEEAADSGEAQDDAAIDELPTLTEVLAGGVAAKSAVELHGATAAEFADFWDGVPSQGTTSEISGSKHETSPLTVTRKRRHSATFTRANTLVARLPADAVDPEVYVNPRDLYVPPSQNTLAKKRPRSAGQVDISGWKEEAAARAQLAARPRSAHAISSQVSYHNPFAAPAVEPSAPAEATESAAEPWDEEGEVMSIAEQFAALRESARQLQEHQEKAKQGSRQTPHQAADRVASDLEFLANNIEDCFPEDSELKLSGTSKPSQSNGLPSALHGPSRSLPFRLSQATLRPAQQHPTVANTTKQNKVRSPQEDDLDLAAFLPDDADVFSSQVPDAEQSQSATATNMLPSDSQALSEQGRFELDPDMFPSDSQALDGTAHNENASADQPQSSLNERQGPPFKPEMPFNEGFEDLFEGMTASQLEALNTNVLHIQHSRVQQTVEAAAPADEFECSPALDISQGEMAGLGADAIRTSRRQTPVAPAQRVSTTVEEPADDEFGEFSFSTQEIRKLLPIGKEW